MRDGIWLHVFLITVFLSCTEKDKRVVFYNEDGMLVKREFYPDSTIKYEWTLKDDTTIHGYGKKFYTSGKLELLVNYSEGKKNGRVIGYFENGSIRYQGQHKDGKEDSVFKWYYKNGKVESINNFLSGKAFGEQFEYYQNGSLKEYFFNDIEGDAVYSKKYDSLGTTIEEVGNPLQIIFNRNQFYENEQFEIVCLIAVPPDCEYELVITKNAKSGMVIGSTQPELDEFIREYYGLKYLFKERMESTGDYSYKLFLMFKELSTRKITRDTASVNVIVTSR
jgi:antitoxin component YwqK of YwqJK toxin-antitoxin module